MFTIADATYLIGFFGNVLIAILALRGRFTLLGFVFAWRVMVDLFVVRLKCERWFEWKVDSNAIDAVAPLLRWVEALVTPLYFVALALIILSAQRAKNPPEGRRGQSTNLDKLEL